MSTARSAALRASAPLALPTAALGVTFGVLAAPIFGAVPGILDKSISCVTTGCAVTGCAVTGR